MNQEPTMLSLVQEYLDYRKGLGFRLRSEGQLLLRFAEYADHLGHQGPLTIALAVQWAKLPSQAAPLYWARRLEVVRVFAEYRAAFDARTEIPPRRMLGPAHRRTAPYIYSPEEIGQLLAAARAIRPVTGLRPQTYTTLFGLLACTGLRISEAVKLDRADVDLARGLLMIRQTKFHKSRIVPLHPSTTEVLAKYARFRDQYHPTAQTTAFFLTEWGWSLNAQMAQTTFRKLRKQLGWLPRNGTRKPRIHDLRHTFACRRLLQWYEENADLDQGVTALATYLGHARVSNTYWYLTGFPELLAVAGARFERFVTSEKGGTP
jgi:integrase